MNIFKILVFMFMVQTVEPQSVSQSERTAYRLEQDKILSTSDGGKTWGAVPQTPLGISIIAWCKDHPEKILAAVKGGLYRTIDGGKSWNVSFISSPNFEPVKIVGSSINSEVVYCLGTVIERNDQRSTQLWYSMNGGVSWNSAAMKSQQVKSVLLDHADEQAFWITDGIGHEQEGGKP